jgi:hypothetical protein
MKVGVHDLQFVSLSEVVSHEWEDPARVDRLKEMLRQEDILRNPPLVARTPTCYVVLDGTTRTHALLELGIRDALVQVVDTAAPGFRLSTWHHMVGNIPGDSLIESLRKLEFEIVALAPAEASAMLLRRELVCYIMLKNAGIFGVCAEHDSNEMAVRLNAIVDLYRDNGEIIRVPSSHLATALEEHPTAETLFAFPQFTHEEILSLAEEGLRVPAGITRFVIPERMLGINVDLGLLRANIPVEHKNQILDTYLNACVEEGKVRLYEEAVLVFEEQHLRLPQHMKEEGHATL